MARTASTEPPVAYSSNRGNLFGRPNTGSQSTDNLNAMGAVGTLFSIVDLTSTSVAALNWHLYRKSTSGKKEDRVEVTSHAAIDTLNDPNAFTSREELFEVGQQHLDLTGEAWFVIVTSSLMSGVPLGLWSIRPDRIEPVPDPKLFISGYVYTGPDGEKIPLGLDQVLRIRVPDPANPYRGLGPVQSVKDSADGMRFSIRWNMNFFRNGAEPGGVIAFNNRVDDVAWNEFQTRWRQAHRGVDNAHTVATLEDATWIDRKYTHTEMGFEKLYDLGDRAIQQAFKVHSHMLGQAEDVNLANATAAQSTFDRQLTVPRGNRWRGMLNRQYLPKFGPTATGLEFDYDNPVTEDEKSAADTFLNRARGATLLVQGGWDGAEVATAAGLPDMKWSAKAVAFNQDPQSTFDQPAARAPRGGGDVHPKA